MTTGSGLDKEVCNHQPGSGGQPQMQPLPAPASLGMEAVRGTTPAAYRLPPAPPCSPPPPTRLLTLAATSPSAKPPVPSWWGPQVLHWPSVPRWAASEPPKRTVTLTGLGDLIPLLPPHQTTCDLWAL